MESEEYLKPSRVTKKNNNKKSHPEEKRIHRVGHKQRFNRHDILLMDKDEMQELDYFND
jgi:hypothetical protein